MLEALVSAGPHPSIPQNHRIFEPFIGEWDLEVRWYDRGEVVRHELGEWSFGWILEGRGVEDVWIVPPRGQRRSPASLYEYGTSVRIYVPELQAWRSTWIGPMHGVVRTFVARKNDDNIVLETDRTGDEALRWVFSDIGADAFIWRNFVHRLCEWELQQDFLCVRRQ